MNKFETNASRRKFLKQMAAGATTATAASVIPSRAFSANKQLTVGPVTLLLGDFRDITDAKLLLETSMKLVE